MIRIADQSISSIDSDIERDGVTPMQKWKVAVVQMDVTIGEPETNWAHMDRLLYQLVKPSAVTEKNRKPDIIILPEMWNIGYALEEAPRIADMDGKRTISYFSDFCKKHQVNVIAGSIAMIEGEKISNCAIVFNRNGEVVHQYRKAHLFQLMDEHLHLTSGNDAGLFDLDGVKCGLMICYDIRFPEWARNYALAGAEVLFVPAQWPHPRLEHWRTLLQARAIENQMMVVACNRSGKSGDTEFVGHSVVIDPWGTRIAELSENEAILHAELDLDLIAHVRKKIPIFADRRPNLYE